jgi:hypothetical protein
MQHSTREATIRCCDGVPVLASSCKYARSIISKQSRIRLPGAFAVLETLQVTRTSMISSRYHKLMKRSTARTSSPRYAIVLFTLRKF